MRMSLEYINRLLATLPANATFDIRFQLADRTITNRLMARDMPGPERRCTNLDSGSEWFLPLNENLDVTEVWIHSLAIEVIQ